MTSIDTAVWPYRPRAVITRLAIALAATLLTGATGCAAPDSATGPKNEGGGVAGSYSLSQANASKLPAKLYHGPYYDADIPHFWNQLVVTVTDGALELDDDGRYALSIDLSFTADGESASTSVDVEGDYEVQGDQVFFTADGGAEYSGRVQNGTLVLELPSPLAKSDVKSHQYQFRK